MDQFRRVSEAEQLLAVVDGIEGLDMLSEELAGRVPEKWLALERVGHGFIPSPSAGLFVDVVDEELLAELNLRPRIQKVLSAHPEAFGPHPRLDFGSIRASGDAARALTQAVSREVYDHWDQALGIRYESRHSETEECWAVFDDRATILFDPDVPYLDALSDEHTRSVRSAAELLHLLLPPVWS
jgi:hypothetical protein